MKKNKLGKCKNEETNLPNGNEVGGEVDPHGTVTIFRMQVAGHMLEGERSMHQIHVQVIQAQVF